MIDPNFSFEVWEGNVKYTINRISKLYGKAVRKVWEKDIQRISKARWDPNLYSFLEYYCKKFGYTDDHILRDTKGLMYPSLVFRADKNQMMNIEYPLRNLSTTRQKEFQKELYKKGKKHLEKIELLTPGIKNLDTYVLDFFDISELKIDCNLGNYKDMIRTCNVLEYELLLECGKKTPSKNNFDKFWKRLELRKSLHEITNPVVNGKWRSCAIGISTPIIYKDVKTYKMLIGERSNRVAVHGDLLHIAPSFMFQPIVGPRNGPDYNTEFKVERHQIEREFLEEIFHYKDAKFPPKGISRFEWYDDGKKPELTYLREMLSNGDAELLFTGIAFSLLDLRPEICTALLIKTEDWIRDHQKNATKTIDMKTFKLKSIYLDTEEFKDSDQMNESKLRKNSIGNLAQAIDLGNKLEKPISSHLPREITVPQGAAAAFLAVEAAKIRLNIK